jgi:hypothetical protein
MKFPDEPNTDWSVHENQNPVACQDEKNWDQQLEPQFGNVPEIQSSTTFLCI